MKKIFNFLFADKKISFKNKVFTCFIVNFSLVFSVFIFIPFETYLGNANEFSFGFISLAIPVILLGLILIAGMTIFELLFKGNLFKILISLVFGVTLACYAQGMILNGMMKTLDGSSDNWSSSQKIINLLIWIAIAITPAVILFFAKKLWKTVPRFGSILIVVMQIVALLSMVLTVPKSSFDTRMTTDGLYEVAKKNNVIIFVLDRFDQKRIDELLDEDPEFLDDLKGFTYFPNTSGSYTFTHNAMPYLFTGMEMEDFYPTSETKSNATKNSEYLQFIKKQTGNMGVYTKENFFENTAAVEAGVADNVRPLKTTTNKIILLKASIKSSLYRILPFAFKSRFEYTSATFNTAVSGADESSLFGSGSHYYDAQFLDELEKVGLSINNSYGDNSFRLIHTFGAHYPFELTADGEYTSTEVAQTETCKGEFKILHTYFEELNRLGLYEDATIIITADHGDATLVFEEDKIIPNTNPILFYKQAGKGMTDEFETSLAPASHMDIFPTIIKALGGNIEDFGENAPSFEGIALDELTEDTERTRYFYIGCQDPNITDHQSFMSVEFIVNGDARVLENWKATGRKVYTQNTNHGFEAAFPGYKEQ